MKRLIIVLMMGALLLSSCSHHQQIDEPEPEAIKVANTESVGIKSSLLTSLESEEEVKNKPTWTELDWVIPVDGKIDTGKMSSINQTKLEEVMERDIIQMFKTRSVLAIVTIENKVTIVDIYVTDRNVSLLFCFEVEKAAESIASVLLNDTVTRINYCDSEEATKAIEKYTEPDDLKAKIGDTTIFTVSLQSLPEADTKSEAIFKEYIRKHAIYDTYGAIANRQSDPIVLKDLYETLESTGNEVYVVAPRLGDGIFIAMKYKDLDDTAKFNIINNAKEYYGDIIGKPSQVTTYYYSDSGWARLEHEVSHIDKMKLEVADIECIASTAYLNTNEDFLRFSGRQYEVVGEWVFLSDNRDKALLEHYKNGGSKQTFNWNDYPVGSSANEIAVESDPAEREIKWNIMEYSLELSEGKMSGYPATGGEFIPREWFSKWHNLDYIKTDARGRIDLLAIREYRREADYADFARVLKEDLFTYIKTTDVLIYPIIYNGNIKMDIYIRDDLLTAKRIFEDLERIHYYLTPLFTPETKIKLILNICDPAAWKVVMREYEDIPGELMYLNELLDNRTVRVMKRAELEDYIEKMLPAWLEAYCVRFKMDLNDYEGADDIAQSMLNAYYRMHAALEQAK